MPARLFRPLLLAAATVGLAGCAYGGPGGYGYTGVSAGYSSGRYYSPYYDHPYYGWYDGFYYPGSGYYVYDPYGYRYRWSDPHRRYWEARRWHRHRDVRDNWDDYYRERERRGIPGRPAWTRGQTSDAGKAEVTRQRTDRRGERSRGRTESRRSAPPATRERSTSSPRSSSPRSTSDRPRWTRPGSD